MNPREMVSELLALVGDPAAKKIPEPLALRMLNDAQLTIANLLYPLYPSLFRTVTTSSGDGSTTVFTIPAACAKLERVSIDSATGLETDCIELAIEDFGATVSNQFYTGAIKEGQVFYAHRGDRQLVFSPAPPADINFYYQKKPTEMKYDYGRAIYTVLAGPPEQEYLTDSAKEWLENELINGKVIIGKNLTVKVATAPPTIEGTIESNTDTQINITYTTFGIYVNNSDIVEYDAYVPSDIPKKYHPLIVKKAVANLDGTRAQQLESEIEKEFIMMAGGR